MESLSEFFNTVAKGLSHKAEALLVLALAVVALAAISFGVDPWLAFGSVGALYLAYIFRSGVSDRHEALMAEKDIEKIERENHARLAQRKRRLIEKKTK